MTRPVAVICVAACAAAALAAPSGPDDVALCESLVRDELDKRAVAA